MAFTDNLAANPSSGVYGGIGPNNNAEGDVLDFVNKIKDRNMQDFKNRAVFMNTLQNQQANLRRVMSPEGQQSGTMGEPIKPPMNVQQAPDPNQMMNENQVPFPIRAELANRDKQANVESQRIAQQGKFGQEALDIKSAQEKLNQQKSDQIDALKIRQENDKVANEQARAKAVQDAQDARNKNFSSTLQQHKDQMQQMKDKYDADREAADARHQANMDAMDARTKILEEAAKQKGRTTQTTSVGGQTRTQTTEKGTAADRVQVIGKDGKAYMIPGDKVNDMDSDGTPHWKPVQQDDQPQGDNNEGTE
jgi:hypothetical protein